MKKKEVLTAIGLTVALSMTGCASKEITQTKTETTVELGSECTIIPTDYFELGSKVNPDTIAVDTSAVDTNTVGEYVAVVTYNDSTYEIKVSVSDTTAPEISAKTDITPVDRGTTIYPADYVEVNDLSEVAVYFVAEDGDNESLEIPSDLDNDVTEINYTVVAVDAESNRSEELSVTIPIIPEVIEEPTQPDEGNLQIDASGVDGTTEEDEYDETRDNLNIKPTEETSTEKITLEPDENGEITVTQEEADAIAKQLLEEIMKGAENTTPQYDYSNVPEGFTPSTGELPKNEFGHGGQAPAGRLE